jgi:hypothetical protein
MRRMCRWPVLTAVALSMASLALLSGGAAAQDSISFSEEPAQEDSKHEGYYYPKPQTVEQFVSSAITLPESDKTRRQAFVIGMTKQLLDGKYAPGFVIFAKGDQSEKLIIVGTIDGQINTVYRARALLAQMTAVARASPFFQQNVQPEESTFFDFMKLLGFRQITITDGRDFAHQAVVD